MDNMEEKLNQLLNDPGAMQTIMELAQKLSGSGKETAADPQEGASDIDPSLLTRFLPLLKNLRDGSKDSCKLLYALAPYLSEKKQENIPRAVKMGHIIHVAKEFLSEGGWDLV